MKLEEQFDKLDEFDEGGDIYCHNAEQCTKIAEDFAIGFAEWIIKGKIDKQLLEIYKQTL